MSEDIKSTDSHIIQYLDSHNLSAEIQPKAQQNLTQDNLQNLQEFRTTLQEEANIHSNIQKVQNVAQNAQISQQRQIQGDQIDHQSTQHQQPQQIHLQNYILAAVQSQQVGENEAKTQTEIVFEENHQCQLSARYYTELEGNTKLPSDHNEAEVNSNHDQQLTLNEVQNLQTEAQPNDYQPEIEHEYEQIPVQEYRQSDFFAEKEEANSQNSCFKFVGMEEENSVVRDQKFLVEIQKKFGVEQIVEVQTLEQPKEKIERSVVQQNQADLSVKNNEVLEVKFTRSLVSDTMFKKSQTTITKIQQTISSALPKQITPSQIKILQTKAVQKMEVSTVPPVQKVAESIKKEFKVQGREAQRPNIEQPINRTLQTSNSAYKVEKKAQNGIPQLITQHKQIQETVLNSKDQKQKMRLHQRIVQNITIETNAVQINPAPHNLKVSQNPQPNVKQLPKRLQQPTVKPQTNEVNPIQSYVKQLPKRPQNTRQRPQHIQYFQKVQSYVKDPPPKPLQQNPAQNANNLMKMRQVNQLKISEEEQVEKQHSRHQQQSVEQPQQPIKTGKKKKKHAQSNLERPKHPKQDALPPNRLDNNNIVPPQPAFNASKAPSIQNEPLERGHGNALNVLPNPLPPLPASQADSSQPVTNTFIIQQAQKQRMDSTYKIFLKYMVNYTKALNFYKSIVQNVYQELFRKKNQKRVLEATLMSYFQGHASLSNQFHEQCMKIFPVEVPGSNNPFGNLRLQLRRGFDELTYLRKGVAAQNQKMGKFVRGTSIPGISKALALFYDKITAQQRKFLQKRQLHATRQQMFYKVVAQVDKVFRQGVQGKYKKDILVEIARLINQEQGHRQILRNYGRAILPLRATYISAENQLFQSLQKILNQFKNQSKLAYFVGRREFHHVEDLSGHIRQKSEFQELSPLTDTDYIKYVLELEQRKETNEYSNSHFQRFLELTYFDKLVGPIRSIYRGTITKSFPLTTPNEQLIHTISGNLVQFNRQMDHTLNFFVLRHISAKIINEGVVEFDEVLKGIIFDDYRTIRVKLADGDRAEELICYLDRTTETIVVG